MKDNRKTVVQRSKNDRIDVIKKHNTMYAEFAIYNNYGPAFIANNRNNNPHETLRKIATNPNRTTPLRLIWPLPKGYIRNLIKL